MSVRDRTWRAAAAAAWLTAGAVWLGTADARTRQAPPGAAALVTALRGAPLVEARAPLLDTPVLPGSVMKAWALAAALESGIIEPRTARLCRRRVVVDGRAYVCAHPDLRRPLGPAEALAHSCNDYFVALAPRLPRAAFDRLRLASGLPALGAAVPLAAGLVGLGGPSIPPRALLSALARLAGVQVDGRVVLAEETRRVLLDGLRGAAAYGSASALGHLPGGALAKTGTAPMPGGGTIGLVVALTPAAAPLHGAVVALPGAAGVDAAGVAADLLLAASRAAASPAGAPAAGSTGAHGSGVQPAPPSGMPLSARPPAIADDAALRAASAGRTLRLGVEAAGRLRVETVALEEYVARVLAGEGQPRAGEAAQQALAIAARTFAIANLGRHDRDGYDLCDTTHCQVVRPATPVTRRAALASAGRVLLAAGAPASVFYSAHCGGRPERASAVWAGAVDYGDPPREDEACRDEPGWVSVIAAGEIERALRMAGWRGTRLRDLRILGQNASGRVTRLRVDGFTPAVIAGADFRAAIGRALGWQRLRSTSFELRRTATGYRFAGRGFGHGVGLCVIGAGHRAARGDSADEILRFYYPSLAIGSIAAGASAGPRSADVQPSTGAPRGEDAPPVRPAPAAADIRLALPAAEEHERDWLLAFVRAARDEIARRAGVDAPAAITLTVHPSVEAFGRATGRPWWAAAATRGAHIDLLPVALLRQRGQLERTIRHELAHATLDSHLVGRPLWVREGAAAYFANPDVAVPAGAVREPCPADIELAHAVSAGAERDAYARAEQCFRHQMAGGRHWRNVR